MEKQKVFWVVLSVSVFVVIVLVAGVMLLRQQPAGAPRATVSPMTSSDTQVYEYQRTAPQSPTGTGPQAGAPQAGTPQPGDQQTMHFFIGEGGTQTPPAPGTTPQPAGSAPAAGTAPLAAAPGPVIHPQTMPRVKPGTAKPSVQARAPRKTPDYWIQTGSYKSQSKAEEMVTLLEGKGLGSRVFSFASNGDTFYRVRVGPYSNKGEADKFLALVKQVQGLESSYISMVPAVKSSIN
jgi:cell division protein FtsN